MDKFRNIYSKLNSGEYDDNDLDRYVKKLKYKAFENDCLQIHKLLALIYTIQGNYYKAQGEYHHIIGTYKKPSGYFGLFKINILKGNFDNLDYYLDKYVKNISYKEYSSSNFGINLYKGLVNVYNSLSKFEEPNFNFEYTDNILGCQIINIEMENEFKKAITFLNERKYIDALNCLKRCDEINKEKKFTCNFYTAITLLEKIIQINFLELPSNNEIKEECKIQNDIDNFIIYLDKEMKERKYNIEAYLDAAYYLINKGYFEKAKEILNKCKENDLTKKYKVIIKYLFGIIKNKEEEDNYDVQQYLYYSNEYNNKYNVYNIEGSLYYLCEGLEKTKANIFNYFIGKVYYMATDYENAKKYLNEYLENGGGKRRTLFAINFLLKINYFSTTYTQQSKKKKTKEFYKLSNEYKQILDFNNKQNCAEDIYNWQEDYYEKYIISRFSFDEDEFDFHKNKISQKLNKKKIFPKEYIEKDTSEN